jgi:Tfp pilus assembly protein PilX
MNCMTFFEARSHTSRQRGATLVTALVILVLVLLLGLTAMGNADLQRHLAGNLQFDNNAMNRAEAALGAGEHWLAKVGHFPDPALADATVHCLDAAPDCASSFVVQRMAAGIALPGSSQGVGGRSIAPAL